MRSAPRVTVSTLILAGRLCVSQRNERNARFTTGSRRRERHWLSLSCLCLPNHVSRRLWPCQVDLSVQFDRLL